MTGVGEIRRATAAVLRAKGRALGFEALELDPPGQGEALVQLRACGICATDGHVMNAERALPLPLVAGHEGAGVVLATGPGVGHVGVGDAVVMSMAHCGRCTPCLSGEAFYCDHTFPLNFSFTRLDGSTPARADGEPVNARFFGQSSFATRTVADATSLVRIPHGYDFALAAPLGCGVQTGAGAIINVLRPKPGDGLAVFGLGAVGLSAVMAARLAGAWPIVAVDLNPTRLALARSLGASHAISPAEEADVVGAVRACAPRLDFALDATGSAAVVGQAFDSLGPSGVLASVGADGGALRLNMMGLLGGKELRMVRMGDGVAALNIDRLIRLQQRGVFPVEHLVTRYPFSAINTALEDLRAGRAVKPVLIMDDED